MGRYTQEWVVRHYDEYGDKEWHRRERSPADAVKLHVHQHYVERHIQSGDRVLEVGAGAGRFTHILASLGAKVLVVDVSPVQLDLNRKYARQLGFESAVQDWLQLAVCDMAVLDNASFDAVVCYGGPLSYVFERRDEAVREVLRVLKASGLALFSVMTLWGTVHEFLMGVLNVSPAENLVITQTGDLHPETFRACNHRCHMFRSQELRELLEDNGCEIACMSGSNCLSAAWGDRLADVQRDSAK